MKSQSIALFVLSAIIGCGQCSVSADVGALNPLAISKPDPALPAQANAEIGGPFTERIDSPLSNLAVRSLYQPLTFPGEFQPPGAPNIIRRIGNAIKQSFRVVTSIIDRGFNITIIIIKILLLPITILYNVAKFITKLLFLPLVIGWKILKVLLYPITAIIRMIIGSYPSLSPLPSPYFYGVPTSGMYGGLSAQISNYK